jgi:hypothetical protein
LKEKSHQGPRWSFSSKEKRRGERPESYYGEAADVSILFDSLGDMPCRI